MQLEPEAEEAKALTKQRAKFNFVTIRDIIDSVHDMKQLDLCGINITKEPKKDDIEVKYDGKQKLKGRLTFAIVDRTEEAINVNLWGELSNIELGEMDIVLINGGRMSNFGGGNNSMVKALGKTINCAAEYCKVFINPSRELAPNLGDFVDLSLSNMAA